MAFITIFAYDLKKAGFETQRCSIVSLSFKVGSIFPWDNRPHGSALDIESSILPNIIHTFQKVVKLMVYVIIDAVLELRGYGNILMF